MSLKAYTVPLVPDTPEQLLTPAEVAAQLRVTTHALAKWRQIGSGPSSVRVGNRARYRQTDVTAWVEAGGVTSV